MDINTPIELLEEKFENEGIFASFNAEFCKEHIEEAPCNIFSLIKNMLDEIESLKLRITELEKK